MLSTETIKYLNESSQFKEFTDHIFSEIAKLNTIDDLKKLSDKRAGELVKARAYAVDILTGILEPVLQNRVKEEVTPEKIESRKKAYGL